MHGALIWLLASALLVLLLTLWLANLARHAPGQRAKAGALLALGAGLASLPMAVNRLAPGLGLPFAASVFWLACPLLLALAALIWHLRHLPDAGPTPHLALAACALLAAALLVVIPPL